MTKRVQKRKRDDAHHAAIITLRQAQRMKSGRNESKPTDYDVRRSDEAIKRLEARRRIEEMKERKAIDNEDILYPE